VAPLPAVFQVGLAGKDDAVEINLTAAILALELFVENPVLVDLAVL